MMRKKTSGILKCLWVLALFLLVGGCGKGEATESISLVQNGTEAMQGVADTLSGKATAYSASPIPYPDGVDLVSDASVWDSILYLRAWPEQGAAAYYALDEEGTLLQAFPAAEGDGFVMDICADSGGLWTLAHYTDEEDRYNQTVLFHYNGEGSPDREMTLTEPVYQTVFDFQADSGRDCLYLLAPDTLFVLDGEGGELFTLTGVSMRSLCLTGDGTLAVCDSIDGQTLIRLLDFDGQCWGGAVTPDLDITPRCGGGVYDLYGSDGQRLCGIDLESGICTPVLTWLDAGMSRYGTVLAELEEGRFLIWGEDNLLYLLESAEADSTITLTLATFEYDIAAQEAVSFNAAQDTYRIEIRDYSRYNQSDTDPAGLNQLQLDIAAGDGPDIFDLRSIPLSQYIELGILEDLYPYIDADPDIDRGQFIPSLLAAMETDGGLYALIPHVCIMSLQSAPDALAGAESLSFGDMLALADGTDPFGGYLSRYEFIQYMISGDGSPFVDWESASCQFDSREFADLLALAALLPEEADWNGEELRLFYEDIAGFGSILSGSIETGCGEGEVAVQLGFPGADGARYLVRPGRLSWGMAAASGNKDGVWQFMRTYLLEDDEEDKVSFGLSLNAQELEGLQQNYAQWLENGGEFEYYGYRGEGTLHVEDSRYWDAFEGLVSSVTGLYEENAALMAIIMDEAGAYFAGDRTAEDAAKNIQSRASLYMAEQG